MRKYLVPMKFVINGKNNLFIPQTLYNYDCSRVVKMLQKFRHIENCVEIHHFTFLRTFLGILTLF